MRVFAGQEPSCVWVGWVTPDYHQHDMNFDLTKVRAVTVTMGDEQGNVHSRCQGRVGTVGGGMSALGTWLRSFPPTFPPLFLFIFFQWLLFCFFSSSSPFSISSFLFTPLFHLALFFLLHLLSLFSPLCSPSFFSFQNIPSASKILALRSSGSGVRGFSAQVCRWWRFGNEP